MILLSVLAVATVHLWDIESASLRGIQLEVVYALLQRSAVSGMDWLYG